MAKVTIDLRKTPWVCHLWSVLISGMDLVPATFKSEGFFQDNQFSWYMMRKNTRLHQWFLVYEYYLFIKVERILALQCIFRYSIWWDSFQVQGHSGNLRVRIRGWFTGVSTGLPHMWWYANPTAQWFIKSGVDNTSPPINIKHANSFWRTI
jgi:hypothetical protein